MPPTGLPNEGLRKKEKMQALAFDQEELPKGNCGNFYIAAVSLHYVVLVGLFTLF